MLGPPPHIQRDFPKSPVTSRPPGWMEKDRNDLRYPAGTEPSSPDLRVLKKLHAAAPESE